MDPFLPEDKVWATEWLAKSPLRHLDWGDLIRPLALARRQLIEEIVESMMPGVEPSGACVLCGDYGKHTYYTCAHHLKEKLVQFQRTQRSQEDAD